ncbi:hypothetical protein ABW19_dt0207654 [Dactylella cylindrospora]|nr:hypothetical protein ABW19_dt0207654 [Dactylella cylindrospora]
MQTPYQHEMKIAELAVQKAAIVTETVRASIEKGVLSKDDKTPVTIADFAAQAILVSALKHNFPEDEILAEEEAEILRRNPKLLEQVWDLVSSAQLEDHDADKMVPSPNSIEQMINYIDAAGLSRGRPSGRVWMIDPVDGTKSFVEGGLYVVMCTLVVDGEQTVTALGSPLLSLSKEPTDADADSAGPGYLLSVEKGQGAYVRPLSKGLLLEARKLDPIKQPKGFENARFIDNISSRHFPQRDKIADELGIPFNRVQVYSSQARYVAMALGGGEVCLRVPKPTAGPLYVYDYAGGALLFEELGGKITDANGITPDLTAGRSLSNTYGAIAAPQSLHPHVLEATRKVLALYPEYATRLI